MIIKDAKDIFLLKSEVCDYFYKNLLKDYSNYIDCFTKVYYSNILIGLYF